MTRVTIVVGAVGTVVALVVLAAFIAEIAEGDPDASTVAVAAGILALVGGSAVAGWRSGPSAVRWTAVASWIMVGAFVGGGLLAVALQDVNAELPNALFFGVYYLGWLIVPALCAPAFLAWAGAWANRRRGTRRRGGRGSGIV